MIGLGKRATTLAFLALLAVALSGAGHSVWYEELGAKAEVQTGTLDGALSCANGNDNELGGWPTGQPYSSYPSLTEPLDIGAFDITPVNSKQFNIAVEKGYPGYAARCNLTLDNTGSVAWHLEDIRFTVSVCHDNICQPLAAVTTQCNGTVCSWGNLGQDGPSPVYVAIHDDEGCQVHSQDAPLTSTLFFGINDTAEENTDYKVGVSYTLVPWNVSAWTGCGEPRTQ